MPNHFKRYKYFYQCMFMLVKSFYPFIYLQRHVQDFLHQGQIPFLGEGGIFIRGRIEPGGRKKLPAPPPPKQCFALRGKFLIIAKERLFFASVPYAPHESFFHQGQKHIICPSYMIYQGHMARIPLYSVYLSIYLFM